MFGQRLDDRAVSGLVSGAKREKLLVMNTKTKKTDPAPPLKALIVDDHVLVRQGMLILLDSFYPGADCIEAANAAEAIAAAEKSKGIELVLLDLKLPDDNGFDLLDRLVAILPDAAIVIVSASEDADDINRAYNAGIRGYIAKSASQDVLKLALPLMLSGETYVSAIALAALRGSGPAGQAGGTDRRSERSQLTPRQREILVHMANGLKNREIADQLDTLEGTVKVHVKTILLKLGASNRTHAVIQALRLGLIPADTVQADGDWEV